MSRFEYYTPTDVGSAFRTEQDVSIFCDYMVEELEKSSNGKGNNYVPPIVHNARGKVFNIEYNFIIKCLSKFLEDDAILGDFSLTENSSAPVIKAGIFLVVGILEDYYGVVRANSSKVDLSKYKNSKSINVTKRFYNVVAMKNGDEIRRLNAVPFSESELKRVMTLERFLTLEAIAKNEKLEQVAFGLGQFLEYEKLNGLAVQSVEI